MRQRRRAAAALNAGFSVTASLLALISRLPILLSLAHDGTNPQRALRSVRWAASSPLSRGTRSKITRAIWVGATFQDGAGSSPTIASTSNSLATSESGRATLYLPHTRQFYR